MRAPVEWPPAMRATAEAVEGSKVRLSVRVDESEIDEALEATVKKLSREVRVPGFRPGKV
ncbi:MAG: trigger factor family protein, partial [Acidimicrobiales bacterium]